MMYVFDISYPKDGVIESFSKKLDCKTEQDAFDYFNELLEQYPPDRWYYLCKFYEEDMESMFF